MVEQVMTIRQALNGALHQTMADDDTIICIGEDIAENGGVFGVTEGLVGKFGAARVIGTPISETAFVGMGAGAAMTGLKPVVELMFCDFAGVCFDQIMNQAAKARFLSNGRLKLPLVIRTTMGAGDGSGAMHSASLHSLFASVAGLTVVCPSTPADAAGLLKAAIRSDGPVVFMENKHLYDVEGPVEDGMPEISIGRARIVLAGEDVSIVAVSAMVQQALAAANNLNKKSISVEVIDPLTVKPLDIGAITKSVRKTGRLLVVDEGAAFAGFADAVISAVSEQAFGSLRAAPRKLCAPDIPVPYAPAAEQRWLPDSNDIVQAVTRMMEA